MKTRIFLDLESVNQTKQGVLRTREIIAEKKVYSNEMTK